MEKMFEISASKFYHSKFALDWQRIWGDWCLTAESPTCTVLGAAPRAASSGRTTVGMKPPRNGAWGELMEPSLRAKLARPHPSIAGRRMGWFLRLFDNY